MYEELEFETRRMAAKLIGDVATENAELVLNSVQSDFMGGAYILLEMLSKKLSEKDYSRIDLLEELQSLQSKVQLHLIKT